MRQATVQLDDGWTHTAVFGLEHRARMDGLALIFACR